MLKNAFKSVVQNVNSSADPLKIMKKIMIKTLGERDFSAQETMHLLLSLKLYSSSFELLPVNLNGSRHVRTNQKERDSPCTNDSLLDKYAKRSNFQNDFTHMKLSFAEFVTMYRIVKNKLTKQSPNVIPRFHKPWKNSQNVAWDNLTPSDNTFVNSWMNYFQFSNCQQTCSKLGKTTAGCVR